MKSVEKEKTTTKSVEKEKTNTKSVEKEKTNTKSVKKLFEALEKECKTKNNFYAFKSYEKYDALTVKEKGKEKLKDFFKTYEAKNEKEKQYISILCEKTYYGKNNQDSLKYIKSILDS